MDVAECANTSGGGGGGGGGDGESRKGGSSSSRLAALPDALIGHIASYGNVFAIGNMCVAASALSVALCAASSFWREYFKEQYPHSGQFGMVSFLNTDADGCVMSRDSEDEGEGEGDEAEAGEETEAEVVQTRSGNNAATTAAAPAPAAAAAPAPAAAEGDNLPGPPPVIDMRSYRRRVIRSKLCEHFGCCPRCSEDALVADTMAEFQERIMLMVGRQPALVPVVFGFPSPALVALAKDNLLHLGEDHIIPGDSPVWCCIECHARFTVWPFLHPLIVEK